MASGDWRGFPLRPRHKVYVCRVVGSRRGGSSADGLAGAGGVGRVGGGVYLGRRMGWIPLFVSSL